jgi:hypothetical protein
MFDGRRIFQILVLTCLFAAPLAAFASTAAKAPSPDFERYLDSMGEDDDASTLGLTIDRKPGILGPATDRPTGPNAKLYTDELILTTEEPVDAGELD